ncbi:MAG TPA: hypothetical protein VGF23_24920 [Gaiellaceae bacterium]|jgi:hypothetical protein
MTLERAGFFRELRHGNPDGPSLAEGRDALPPDERDRIAGYLRDGEVLATTGQRVGDALDPERTDVAELAILTDGDWVWPADLAYYVATYGVELPAAFVDAMRARSWQLPALSEDELVAVEAEFLGRSSPPAAAST